MLATAYSGSRLESGMWGAGRVTSAHALSAGLSHLLLE